MIGKGSRDRRREMERCPVGNIAGVKRFSIVRRHGVGSKAGVGPGDGVAHFDRQGIPRETPAQKARARLHDLCGDRRRGGGATCKRAGEQPNQKHK